MTTPGSDLTPAVRGLVRALASEELPAYLMTSRSFSLISPVTTKLRSNTRRTGQFEHRMLLTGEVDTENVEATMSDGVLSITAHKAEAMKPRHIDVKSSKDGDGNG